MSKIKNSLKDSLFYGKILLFGEYGIIEDSMGLSIPYNSYQGSFIFENTHLLDFKDSNKELLKFYNHLVTLSNNNELPCRLDLDAFAKDLDSGMAFDSSIPQGYGVGSSGAIVAAIYDKYAHNKIKGATNTSILKLKNIFGKLESYFHGTSSGLDPLICYLNLPILIKSKSELNTVGLPKETETKGAIFLLNTGEIGKTQPLVELFLDRLKEEGFRNMIRNQFKKYNDASINAFLQEDKKSLLANVKNLSKLALEHFKPMIPNLYHQLWQDGIDSNAYYLKLCGSGGGGFILGFTEDMEQAQTKLSAYDLAVIHKF
jgi:mevalonate kinase